MTTNGARLSPTNSAIRLGWALYGSSRISLDRKEDAGAGLRPEQFCSGLDPERFRSGSGVVPKEIRLIGSVSVAVDLNQ